MPLPRRSTCIIAALIGLTALGGCFWSDDSDGEDVSLTPQHDAGFDAVSTTGDSDHSGGPIDDTPCNQHSDCPDSVCDPVSNTCVECTRTEHCTSATELCHMHRCVGCTRDEHCQPGQACKNFSCAAGKLDLTPSDALTFQIPPGKTDTQTVTLANPGGADIDVQLMRIRHDQTTEERVFILTANNPVREFKVPAGDSVDLEVGYRKLDAAEDRATLILEHSATASGREKTTLDLVGTSGN